MAYYPLQRPRMHYLPSMPVCHIKLCYIAISKQVKNVLIEVELLKGSKHITCFDFTFDL